MKVIQASQAKLDTEVANIQELLKDLAELRNSWQAVWNEMTAVARTLALRLSFLLEDVQLYEGMYQLEREKKAFKKHIAELLYSMLLLIILLEGQSCVVIL